MDDKSAFISGFLFTIFLFWYGGLDYNHRGFLPAMSLIIALNIGALAVLVFNMYKQDFKH